VSSRYAASIINTGVVPRICTEYPPPFPSGEKEMLYGRFLPLIGMRRTWPDSTETIPSAPEAGEFPLDIAAAIHFPSGDSVFLRICRLWRQPQDGLNLVQTKLEI
jgi:hypothetical protein